MPRVDLQDEATQPNPIIGKLVDIGQELFDLAMGSGGSGAGNHYMAANRKVTLAVSDLMAAKNAIASEQGEE